MSTPRKSPCATAVALAILLALVIPSVHAQLYSGSCLENCCCKVCSSPSFEGYPYGRMVNGASNPVNPVLEGNAQCTVPTWADTGPYNASDGTPITPVPDTLWWTHTTLFQDSVAHVAPTSCSCCQLSGLHTSCTEQRPLARKPSGFYIQRAFNLVAASAANIFFFDGIDLSATDYAELRNDTFCGYSTPRPMRRSVPGQMTLWFTKETVWLVLPVPAAGCYTLCYYHSKLTTPTWYNLGTVTVTPASSGSIKLKVNSRSVRVEGEPATVSFGGFTPLAVTDDSAEIRPTGTTCGSGGATVSATSLTVPDGVEWCHPRVAPTTTATRPTRYIPPKYTDCPIDRRIQVETLEWHIPALPAAGTYTVCYRRQATWHTAGTLVVKQRRTAKSALEFLYRSTHGHLWTRNTNWLVASDECTWHGIVCDGSGAVTMILLQRNNLQGDLPEQFFLSDIASTATYLTLTDNALNGTIPQGIGAWTKLTYLDLSQNSLSGDIPDSLHNLKLESIYLSQNKWLNGRIPEKFSDVQQTWLQLSSVLPHADIAPYHRCPFVDLECSDRGSTDIGVNECGYDGISEDECVVMGCCFNSQAPLVFGGKACFTKRDKMIRSFPQCQQLTCTKR